MVWNTQTRLHDSASFLQSPHQILIVLGAANKAGHLFVNASFGIRQSSEVVLVAGVDEVRNARMTKHELDELQSTS